MRLTFIWSCFGMPEATKKNRSNKNKRLGLALVKKYRFGQVFSSSAPSGIFSSQIINVDHRVWRFIQ